MSADVSATRDTSSQSQSNTASKSDGLSEASRDALSSTSQTPADVATSDAAPEIELAAAQERLRTEGRPAQARITREINQTRMSVSGNVITLNRPNFESQQLPGIAGQRLAPTLVQEQLADPAAPATPATPSIDWSLISQLEGGRTLEGYVPDPTGSRSGVTIATGFDIGQQSQVGLEGLFGADNPLVDKLSPYAGLTRDAAVQALAATPLSVTETQATEIDRAVKADALSRVQTAYDNAVGQGAPRFAELPEAAQTVIASVGFQYGNLATRTPSFWGHAVDQDWPAVIDELRNFGDSYPTRRNTEADYLEGRL